MDCIVLLIRYVTCQDLTPKCRFLIILQMNIVMFVIVIVIFLFRLSK